MAWLRLTDADGRETLVNSDQTTEIYRGKFGTDIVTQRRVATFRESVDKIAAMIADAEWRERVLRCACAIMANEHANGLTAEQVWARAARFATMEPERPGAA